MFDNNIATLGNRNSQHSFASVPDVNMARSVFNRSHAVKDTIEFDELTPIYVDEVLPGDTINLNVDSFARLATQTVPVMDNMYIDYFFFYCPFRILWTNFVKMMGEQDDPGDSIDFSVPTITINNVSGVSVGTLYDHFGIPTDVDDITFSALPFRAYYLIWNEWFRAQELQNSLAVDLDDGPDVEGDYSIQKRAKRHDYFTSALTAPQRGDALDLPLGTTAPIYGNGSVMQMHGETDGTDYPVAVVYTDDKLKLNGFTGGADEHLHWSEDSTKTGLVADLTNATAATINQLRNAFMIQSLLERDARGGTRYREIVRSHFNVVVPDYRVQVPEFLSGGSTKIMQHPIPQTSESNTTLQANLAAYSTSMNVGGKIGFTKSFHEHGLVIGLACPRADITYQQGLNRMWSRSTRYDFFWPSLQQLGEQAILTKELYIQGSTVDTGSTGTPNDERTWGYQERYAEYRYKPSEIRGQFRSTYTSSLDVWHLAEEFSSEPSLNSTFIVQNTPIERNLAVAASYPHVLFDAWFSIKHTRPMMVKGVPATLGRF